MKALAIKNAGEYCVKLLPDDHDTDKWDEDASPKLTRARDKYAAKPTFDTNSGNNNCVAAPAIKNAGKYCVETLPNDHNTDKNNHCSAEVLICAPDNVAANKIAEQLHTAASKNPKTTHIIVI